MLSKFSDFKKKPEVHANKLELDAPTSREYDRLSFRKENSFTETENYFLAN